ncbi:MAG: hypothetical protein C4542_05150 [Dehalococcoidia bacterium]|nr:MAG: hypothetical protein C4542_05150 [Dehalococcoidia bacterium]
MYKKILLTTTIGSPFQFTFQLPLFTIFGNLFQLKNELFPDTVLRYLTLQAMQLVIRKPL